MMEETHEAAGRHRSPGPRSGGCPRCGATANQGAVRAARAEGPMPPEKAQQLRQVEKRARGGEHGARG